MDLGFSLTGVRLKITGSAIVVLLVVAMVSIVAVAIFAQGNITAIAALALIALGGMPFVAGIWGRANTQGQTAAT